MTEEKKTPKRAVKKKYTALKNLCTFDGDKVKKGEEFTCSDKDAKHFKACKAI